MWWSYKGLLQDNKQSNGEVPSCIVADTMISMNGFENEVIETAIKEVAGTAFAGIHAVALFQLVANFLTFLRQRRMKRCASFVLHLA